MRGEILPGYVEKVRPDGKLDIGLRPFGGRSKAKQLADVIFETLQDQGKIDLGDKSDPRDIDAMFPGSSKAAFKKAVGKLYSEGKIKPGPHSIELVKKE